MSDENYINGTHGAVYCRHCWAMGWHPNLPPSFADYPTIAHFLAQSTVGQHEPSCPLRRTARVHQQKAK